MLDVKKFLKRMDGIFLSVYLLEFLLKVTEVIKKRLITDLSSMWAHLGTGNNGQIDSTS